MPVVPIMGEHDQGTIFSQNTDYFQSRFSGDPNVAIGKAQVFTDFYLEYFGRAGRLFLAQCRGSSRPQLSPRQVHDSG